MRARNYDFKEVCTALQHLIEQFGAETILDTMAQTMSTDDLADALTDVCDEYDIEMEDII